MTRSSGRAADRAAPRQLLRDGRILAVKGLGGYHLACDARNAAAVAALRERKFRKEKPFALMARDLADGARAGRALARGRGAAHRARPRRSCSRRRESRLPHVAPDTDELGVMLPYTPLHHLLFARRRAGRAGHDERQPLERADRVRGRGRPRATGRHRRRVPRGRAADRPPGGGLGRARRAARAGDPPPRARLRSRRGGDAAGRPAGAGARRRPQERDHAGRGRPGVRQPAHRRPGALRAVPRAWRRRSAICWRCTTSPRDELLVVHDAHPQYRSTAHRRSTLGAPRSRSSSIIGRTSRRCSRSGARGTSGCSA